MQQLRDQVGRLEALLSQMLAEHEGRAEAPSAGAGNGRTSEPERPPST